MQVRGRFVTVSVVVALALAFASLAAPSAASAATVGAAIPSAAGSSCWVAVDTGQSLCVRAGDDLVAAVAAVDNVRLVIPGESRSAWSAGASVRAGVQVSVVLSTIYDDAGYGGGSYTMSVSNGSCTSSAYGFTDLGTIGWDGRVSSYRSYGGCKTAVFSGTSYGGASSGYAVNASSLGSLNDLARSWRVSG